MDLLLKATKKIKDDDETKVAILLACSEDIVLDDYNAKYSQEDKPNYEEVVKELGLKCADGETT